MADKVTYLFGKGKYEAYVGKVRVRYRNIRAHCKILIPVYEGTDKWRIRIIAGVELDVEMAGTISTKPYFCATKQRIGGGY